MSWIAVAAIGGSSILGYMGSQNAADAQVAAAQQSADAQRQMFERQTQLQAPWRQAGETALNALTPLALNYKPFDMNTFAQDPGYAFRLSEGQKALERSAAARGGLLSGATGKALTNYGQQAASQEYQNAFNRYQAERQAQLGPLQSLAGVGQTSANTLSSAAGQLGQGLSDAYVGAGNARASSYMGGANAISNGVGQYLNYSQGNNLINSLQNRSNPYDAYNAGTLNTYGVS